MDAARYARHLALPDFTPDHQHRLAVARVLVIGAGGLGCPCLLYLAAAGVGCLRIADPDRVTLSNLQRQTLYATADIGRRKVEAARERLMALNPEVHVEARPVAFTAETAFDLLAGCDLVIDGSDNFATRYVANDAAVLAGVPLVFGSVFRYEGQVAVFHARRADGSRSPNYRDLFPEPPPAGTVPDCAEGGVLGVLPGLVGTLQALEALKLLTGLGEPLDGRLWSFDARSFTALTLRIAPDPANPLTGEVPRQRDLIDYAAFCGLPAAVPEIDPVELAAWQAAGTDFDLVDVREAHEYAAANLGGRLLPLSELADRWAELDPSRCIVVHCQRGGRSQQAAALLRERGFADVWNLAGGLESWAAAGLPVTAQPED